jgi:hypothetical protein
MSLTCKSITGEGRGFSGASGTGGGRGIGVRETTNSRETWEGSASLERGRGERGEGAEKGDEAQAGGGRATGTRGGGATEAFSGMGKGIQILGTGVEGGG